MEIQSKWPAGATLLGAQPWQWSRYPLGETQQGLTRSLELVQPNPNDGLKLAIGLVSIRLTLSKLLRVWKHLDRQANLVRLRSPLGLQMMPVM